MRSNKIRRRKTNKKNRTLKKRGSSPNLPSQSGGGFMEFLVWILPFIHAYNIPPPSPEVPVPLLDDDGKMVSVTAVDPPAVASLREVGTSNDEEDLVTSAVASTTEEYGTPAWYTDVVVAIATDMNDTSASTNTNDLLNKTKEDIETAITSILEKYSTRRELDEVPPEPEPQPAPFDECWQGGAKVTHTDRQDWPEATITAVTYTPEWVVKDHHLPEQWWVAVLETPSDVRAREPWSPAYLDAYLQPVYTQTWHGKRWFPKDDLILTACPVREPDAPPPPVSVSLITGQSVWGGTAFTSDGEGVGDLHDPLLFNGNVTEDGALVGSGEGINPYTGTPGEVSITGEVTPTSIGFSRGYVWGGEQGLLSSANVIYKGNSTDGVIYEGTWEDPGWEPLGKPARKGGFRIVRRGESLPFVEGMFKVGGTWKVNASERVIDDEAIKVGTKVRLTGSREELDGVYGSLSTELQSRHWIFAGSLPEDNDLQYYIPSPRTNDLLGQELNVVAKPEPGIFGIAPLPGHTSYNYPIWYYPIGVIKNTIHDVGNPSGYIHDKIGPRDAKIIAVDYGTDEVTLGWGDSLPGWGLCKLKMNVLAGYSQDDPIPVEVDEGCDDSHLSASTTKFVYSAAPDEELVEPPVTETELPPEPPDPEPSLFIPATITATGLFMIYLAYKCYTYMKDEASLEVHPAYELRTPLPDEEEEEDAVPLEIVLAEVYDLMEQDYKTPTAAAACEKLEEIILEHMMMDPPEWVYRHYDADDIPKEKLNGSLKTWTRSSNSTAGNESNAVRGVSILVKDADLAPLDFKCILIDQIVTDILDHYSDPEEPRDPLIPGDDTYFQQLRDLRESDSEEEERKDKQSELLAVGGEFITSFRRFLQPMFDKCWKEMCQLKSIGHIWPGNSQAANHALMLDIKTNVRWQEILNYQLIVLAEAAGASAAEGDTDIIRKFTGKLVEAKTFPDNWKTYEWGRRLLRAIISCRRLCYDMRDPEYWDIIEFKVQIFGEVPPAMWNTSKILDRFDYTLIQDPIQDPKHDPEMEQILIGMAAGRHNRPGEAGDVETGDVEVGNVETGDVEVGFVVVGALEGETYGDLTIYDVHDVHGEEDLEEVTFDKADGGREGIKLNF